MAAGAGGGEGRGRGGQGGKRVGGAGEAGTRPWQPGRPLLLQQPPLQAQAGARARTVDHLLRRHLVRAPHDVALHVGEREAVLVHVAAHVAHAADISEHLGAGGGPQGRRWVEFASRAPPAERRGAPDGLGGRVCGARRTWAAPDPRPPPRPTPAHLGTGDLLEQLLRDRARRDAPDRLARAGAAAAGDRADAVLEVVRRVGVGGAVRDRHLAVVARPLVLVAHEHRDGRAERDAVEHARQDLARVLLLARRRDDALPGAAAVELRLDLLRRDRQPRRHAVDDAADALAVGLAERGHAERVAVGAARGGHAHGGAACGGARAAAARAARGRGRAGARRRRAPQRALHGEGAPRSRPRAGEAGAAPGGRREGRGRGVGAPGGRDGGQRARFGGRAASDLVCPPRGRVLASRRPTAHRLLGFQRPYRPPCPTGGRQ
jgi:hypothetical protein